MDFQFMSKSFKVLLFYPNESLSGTVASNLALLAACLKRDGFNDVRLFDCSLYNPPNVKTQDQMREKLGQVKKTDIDNYVRLKEENIYDDFLKVIDEYKPNLIAVSLVDITLKFTMGFLERIKDRHIPVVVGGVSSTFLYEWILNTGLVDYACIGEGEEALVELCNRLYSGQDCRNIRNIYVKGERGIIKNPLSPLVDLDSLPFPDFGIYDDMRFYRPFLGKVVRTLQVDIDRGCPFGCTYCAAPGIRMSFKNNGCGSYHRIRNWDSAFEEIKFLVKKHSLTSLWISSETFFAMPEKKFKEFAEKYKREIGLPFWCQSRLDTFTDEKTRLLADMGCKNISVGLEHGSERIRTTLLKKLISNRKIVEAAQLMAKYDIFPTINNMIGLPDETRADVFEGIRFNREISAILKRKHNINVFTFMPFSGTRLRDYCVERGYIARDQMCNSFFKESVLDMPAPALGKKEIKGLERTILLYILLPESYYPDIKIAEDDTDEGNAMLQKLVAIRNSL
jgi:anaerobic magnesium-protoporphyrin IX monomethyl ester cyclase